MTSGYELEIQRPTRPRRGDSKLIIIALDPNGTEVFRDEANLNEEKTRNNIANRLASITGESADQMDLKLLNSLSQLPPPASPSPTGAALAGTGSFPYEATPGGLILNKEISGEIVLTPLTTFTAIIVGQVVEDDGIETHRLLEIEAVSRNRSYRFKVPAGQFNSMNWHMEHIGAGAALWPGFGTKDHARAAIQFLSGEPPERKVYAHLGWREIEGTWVYLHAGGAIGPVGPVPNIEVSLSSGLERYQLPDPPTGHDLIIAVRASLRMLDVAGDRVTVPAYCVIYRSPLGGLDTGLHVVGTTGGAKTELAALAQQHYGADMGSRSIPGSWFGTDNFLETLAFSAKDAVLVVDDFCPIGSQYDVQAMHKKADRLFRGLGNTAGRGRLRSDGTPRPTKPPRAMVFSTGEDVPRGQSLRARMLVVEMPKVGPGSMNWENLSGCQADAAAGLYAEATAGYLRWLAPRYREIRKNLRTEINALREQAFQSGQHRRTPDIVANFGLGFRYFLDFAQEVGAIDQVQRDELWQRCWSALGDVAEAQQEHQADSDPVQRFGELLAAAISSGAAHLAGPDGKAPSGAVTWGWRESKIGNGGYAQSELHPQGVRIGWIDAGEVYLQSDAAYTVVQRLAGSAGDSLVVTLATLKKRLKERGFLASTELRGGKERADVRRTLEEHRRSVLHLKLTLIFPQGEAEVLNGIDQGPLGHFLGTLIPHSKVEVAHQNGSNQGRFVPVDLSIGPPGPLGPLFRGTSAQGRLIVDADDIVEGEV
ncbi:MAG: hypothetical protein O2913_13215 [Chloroflexi bacterium]|nr:hypothetical protein [Chloroflexota bacterium]